MMALIEILQRGHNLESTSASEHITTTRGDNDRGSVCDGIGVDDKRKHQTVCDGTSECESVRTRKLSLEAPEALSRRLQPRDSGSWEMSRGA